MLHTPPIRINLAENRGYAVHFSRLDESPILMAGTGHRPGPCLVVTDSGVAPRYLGPLTQALESAGWMPRARVIPQGESSKSIDVLRALYDWALNPPSGGALPDRSTPVIGLGGGVVGDLAGFFAATLLRGVPLVHLPTTLLAQVDSAIGGKTGVNHATGKNLIGAIYQPSLVVADSRTLATLPEREWLSGMAEVVKAAVIDDAELFELLGTRWEEVVDRESLLISKIIQKAAAVKAAVVAADEQERGRRAILNFGHTFAHALERATEYAVFSHGEAVAIGMRAALYLSYRLEPALEWKRADALVGRIPVPAVPPEVTDTAVLDAMSHDKKRTREGIRFVVLDAIGQARVATDVPQDLVAASWAFARGASATGVISQEPREHL